MPCLFLCLDFKTLESKHSANLPRNVGPGTQVPTPLDNLDIRIEQVAWGQEIPDIHGRERVQLVGHKVRWYVGPQPFSDASSFHRLLQKEAGANPRAGSCRWPKNLPISPELMPETEPHQGEDPSPVRNRWDSPPVDRKPFPPRASLAIFVAFLEAAPPLGRTRIATRLARD